MRRLTSLEQATGSFAFFSYSRADEGIARWLWRTLDRYKTPKDLAGAAGAHGPVPKSLHKIFRDREDLSSGREVDQALQMALERSQNLIVLCTPASAKSYWVNHEVETFLRLGRKDRIYPVIADGEPNSADPEIECFPPALRELGVLAADLRKIRLVDGRLIGDGRTAGRLKLIAGLLGIPFDALIQRERRRERRTRLLTASVGMMFAVLAGIASLFALRESDARQQAVEFASQEAEARNQATQNAALARKEADAARAAESQAEKSRRTAEDAALRALESALLGFGIGCDATCREIRRLATISKEMGAVRAAVDGAQSKSRERFLEFQLPRLQSLDDRFADFDVPSYEGWMLLEQATEQASSIALFAEDAISVPLTTSYWSLEFQQSRTHVLAPCGLAADRNSCWAYLYRDGTVAPLLLEGRDRWRPDAAISSGYWLRRTTDSLLIVFVQGGILRVPPGLGGGTLAGRYNASRTTFPESWRKSPDNKIMVTSDCAALVSVPSNSSPMGNGNRAVDAYELARGAWVPSGAAASASVNLENCFEAEVSYGQAYVGDLSRVTADDDFLAEASVWKELLSGEFGERFPSCDENVEGQRGGVRFTVATDL